MMNESLPNKDVLLSILENSEKKIFVLYFYADSHPECDALTPILEELISNSDPEQISLEKFNITEDTDVSTKFQIRTVPTIKLLHKKAIIDEMTESFSKEELVTFISKHLVGEDVGTAERLYVNGKYKEALAILMETSSATEQFSILVWRCCVALLQNLPKSKADITKALDILLVAGKLTLEVDALLFLLEKGVTKEELKNYSLLEGEGVQEALDFFFDQVVQSKGKKRVEKQKKMVLCFHILGNSSPLTFEYRKKLTQFLY